MVKLFLKTSLFISLMTVCLCSNIELQSQTPFIDLSSAATLMDEEVFIKIQDLEPHEIIELRAEAIDDQWVKWISYAYFKADENGVVDVNRAAPLDGSYIGIDGMGLLFSLQPESKKEVSFKMKKDLFLIQLKLMRQNELAACSQIIRYRKSPEVQRIALNEQGLVAALFLPPAKRPLPLIVTLSGSNGGLSESRAQLLASHGFAVLALAYFGAEGLPEQLENIPLEYFENAFDWIRRQDAIDSTHIGLYGISRGAELALLLGTQFPESIQAIVATAPSSVVYGAPDNEDTAAWTYQGKAVQTNAPVLIEELADGSGKTPDTAIATTPNFLKGMRDKKRFEEAAIAVEKIRGPILLITGGDDQMWPSALFAEQILKRLAEKKSTISCTHLYYPKAGHGINIPYVPTLDSNYYHPIAARWFTLGGTPKEDDLASRDSWKKLIAFFHEHLFEQAP